MGLDEIAMHNGAWCRIELSIAHSAELSLAVLSGWFFILAA